jgi:hypothetical protein
LLDFIKIKVDGFVKSPSVPLGAGLRCSFIVAAPKGPHFSVFARLSRLGGRAFYETIVLRTYQYFEDAFL